MCGIAGILRLSHPDAPASPLPEAWLDALDLAIAHRGPDGHGRFRDTATRADRSTAHVALVHRRLSIIDHEGGAQPMTAPATPPRGPLAVAFNGCIYNHRDLRARLESLGHRFQSHHSDTEVLLHGWRAWQHLLPGHLSAMGAWLLWDRDQGRLIAGTDPFAEKPLYLWGDRAGPAHPDHGLWVFASSAAACQRVAAAIGAAPAPDLTMLLSTGAGPPWPAVRRLMPGTLLATPATDGPRALSPLCGLDNLTPNPQHHLHHTPRRAPSPRTGDVLHDLESLLLQAVHQRLEADVPLACLLSGGADSSLIAWAASRVRPDLHTLCVRMPDPRLDESQHAQAVAEALGVRHQTIDAGQHAGQHAATTAAEDLTRLIHTLGSPFGDSSLLPAYWVCRAAASHAKVVLTGDGGDELFLGYERYQIVRTARTLAPLGGALALLAAPLASAPPTSRLAKAGRLCRALGGDGYADLLAIFPRHELTRLLPSTALPARPAPLWPNSPAAARDAELQGHFVHDLLTKIDHASLLAGVEARAPMLDPALAAFATSLPEDVLLPQRERKGLLRALARRHLPAGAVDRRKQGFAVPIGEWFRSDFGSLRTLLTDHLTSADPFPPALLGVEISQRRVRELLDEHLSGRRDHAHRLFLLLTIAIWARPQR